jgi:hypothetical protein
MIYRLPIRPEDCRSDAEVEAMRGTLPNVADYEHLIDEDAIVEGPEGVLARLARNSLYELDEEVVTKAAELLRNVHGDLSNRGSIVYQSAMMNRERTDNSLGFTKEVPPAVLQLLREQNARLGLTGPYSDYLGYVDKTVREPFCRETAWSLERPDIFEMSKPLVEMVEYVNKRELPDHWQRQREFMSRVSRDFKYNDSMFSTVTINSNMRCCYHTDDKDFRGGMGNLIVLELGQEDSGILVMPRERVAFRVRPGDCLLMNVHRMHGNLELTPGGTRLTAVLYAREQIDQCS